MTSRIVPALALLFAFCAASVGLAQQDFEEKIVGKWQVDVAKTRAHLKFPSPASDADEDFLKGVGKLSIEFGSGHSIFVDEGGNAKTKGHWELVKDDAGKVEIDLIRQTEEEATRATIEFLDPNSISIATKGERPLVFVRSGTPSIEGIAAKLIGSWECDKDATEKLDSNKEFSQGQLEDMMQEAGSMIVRFDKDGSFVVTTIAGGEERELKGTWKSSHVDEGKHTFELSIDAERGPDTLLVELRDDGSVCFSPPDEPSAVFVRKNAKSEKLP